MCRLHCIPLFKSPYHYKLYAQKTVVGIEMDQLLVIILSKFFLKIWNYKCEYFLSSMYCLFTDFEFCVRQAVSEIHLLLVLYKWTWLWNEIYEKFQESIAMDAQEFYKKQQFIT